MMDWYGPGMGWWGYLGMGIGTVLLILLVISAVVALVVFVTRDADPTAQSSPQAPEAILAARFARGEISETEYRERLAVLHDSSRA